MMENKGEKSEDLFISLNCKSSSGPERYLPYHGIRPFLEGAAFRNFGISTGWFSSQTESPTFHKFGCSLEKVC